MFTFLGCMVESLVPFDMEKLDLSSQIEGYYLEENPKSVLIKLPSGASFWIPKRFIDLKFFRESSFKQEFIIDNWILKKIGFRIRNQE